MKLLNQSIMYLAVAFLFVVALWSVVFYFSMFDEIKNSIDEELEYQKRLIIINTVSDSVIAVKPNFDENLYTIVPIDKEAALASTDSYVDTEILMQDADDESPEPEPVRMLITTFQANDSYYRLKIANPIIEQDDLVKVLQWHVIGLYIILIVSILVINNIILRKLWKPFYNFLKQLKSYKIYDPDPPSKINTSIKEFNDLQEAVGEMTHHSKNAYNLQKEFIENAAHELQTPLAVISNKLELLFEDEQLNELQAQKLTETYQILQRLTKFNKSLLLLTRIENKQIGELQAVNFNNLIFQYVEEFEEITSYKNLSIDVQDQGTLVREMDKSHAQILIANLIKNAIYHNVENGMIEITMNSTQLTICNTGRRYALDKNKIFNRFHKDDASNASTGLGLTIVKAIAQLYSIEINYEFVDSRHHFQLFF